MAGLLAGLNEQFEFCSTAALLRNLGHYAAVLVPGGTALPEAVRSALDACVGNGGVLIREPSGVPEGHCYWEDGGETILLRTGYRPLELRDGGRVIAGLRPPLVPYAPPGVPWRSSFTPPAPEGVRARLPAARRRASDRNGRAVLAEFLADRRHAAAPCLPPAAGGGRHHAGRADFRAGFRCQYRR